MLTGISTIPESTNMNIKIRLTVMNFLQFGLWGAYLTSMGAFLAGAGFASKIGLFYAAQGFVSIFMPAIIGIVADRWVPAQKLLGLCHLIAAAAMAMAGYAGAQANINFGLMFTFYTISVAFYMPTIALSNSVAYTVLRQNNFDTVKVFSVRLVLSAPCLPPTLPVFKPAIRNGIFPRC